ncbi:MAG: alpha-N-arabinofuranosidase, partial [Anaerolineae bacterium]|nr:alpha-N-arabinofuranosidase [Anaerolineae bacterium]
GVLRYVKAKNRSKKDVYLSWDEWNVWYKATLSNDVQGKWGEAPHLIEEVYNLEDALVAAQWMNVFLRKSDVLKIACLAQIVNVIAPILTTKDAMLKQSIYYPFMLFSKMAAGNALDVSVRAPMYSTAQFGDMPVLDVSASYDDASNKNSIFIVNRSQTESMSIVVDWQDRVPRRINAVEQVSGTDPKAANSFENPNAIVSKSVAIPVLDGKRTTLVVPPLSFTAIDISF